MIFVFGSNLAGRHGKGAALYAKNNHGAEYGVGEGRTGDAYALPTKDENIQSLSYPEISKHVKTFCDYARANQDEVFLVTPVGTGLAGYSIPQISELFKKHRIPANCFLSSTWICP